MRALTKDTLCYDCTHCITHLFRIKIWIFISMVRRETSITRLRFVKRTSSTISWGGLQRSTSTWPSCWCWGLICQSRELNGLSGSRYTFCHLPFLFVFLGILKTLPKHCITRIAQIKPTFHANSCHDKVSNRITSKVIIISIFENKSFFLRVVKKIVNCSCTVILDGMVK